MARGTQRTPGPSITDEAEPAKLPSGSVLEDVIQKVDKGDVAGLERTLDALILDDSDYTEFGRRVSGYVRKYDDDAIAAYMSNQRKGTHG